MKNERPTQMFVNPNFKKIIKANASIQGITIIDYTKQLGEQLANEYEKQKERKKNEYWFKF